MTRLNERKLNHFMVSTPPGVVLTTEWLENLGISPKLAWWYLRSGLLERLGMKAYKRAGDTITWMGAVAALQSQLKLPMHIGGKTALQLLGRAHFLPIHGIKQVSLFALPQTRVPRWLENNQNWSVRFSVIKTSLFQDYARSEDVLERSIDGINLQLSSPERAVMEMIYLVPKHQTYEEAAIIMENLGQLRPAVVQSLLERCLSIKVKRLFLYLGEKYKHSWFEKLDLSKIDLGSGKRVIAEGGKYDSKYMISAPLTNEDKDESR